MGAEMKCQGWRKKCNFKIIQFISGIRPLYLRHVQKTCGSMLICSLKGPGFLIYFFSDVKYITLKNDKPCF